MKTWGGLLLGVLRRRLQPRRVREDKRKGGGTRSTRSRSIQMMRPVVFMDGTHTNKKRTESSGKIHDLTVKPQRC